VGRSAPPPGRLGGRSCRLGAQDDLQGALWRFLAAEVGHVSVERVLSGPASTTSTGFSATCRASPSRTGSPSSCGARRRPPVISRVGLEGRAEICVRASAYSVAIYGAEAGNLGLRVHGDCGSPTWGGGIAPRLLPALRSRTFLDAFAPRDDCVRSSKRSGARGPERSGGARGRGPPGRARGGTPPVSRRSDD